jgi:hypothetical protein
MRYGCVVVCVRVLAPSSDTSLYLVRVLCIHFEILSRLWSSRVQLLCGFFRSCGGVHTCASVVLCAWLCWWAPFSRFSVDVVGGRCGRRGWGACLAGVQAHDAFLSPVVLLSSRAPCGAHVATCSMLSLQRLFVMLLRSLASLCVVSATA